MTNHNVPQDAHKADPYIQQWHIWHAQRVEELSSPHGYLSPTSINWINDGQSKTIEGIPGTWSSKNDVLVYTPEERAQVYNAETLVEQPLVFVPTAFGEEALGYLDYGDIRIEVNAQTNLNDQNNRIFMIPSSRRFCNPIRYWASWNSIMAVDIIRWWSRTYSVMLRCFSQMKRPARKPMVSGGCCILIH